MLLFFWTFYFELLSSGQSELIAARETNWNSIELSYDVFTLFQHHTTSRYYFRRVYLHNHLVHVDKLPKTAVEEGWYSTTASTLNDLYRIPALPQFFFILVVVKVGKGIAYHTVGLSSDIWNNDHNITKKTSEITKRRI